MHAGKDVENREGESSAVKGKLPRVLALHASVGGTKRDYVDSADDVEFISEMRPPPMGKRDFGALTGRSSGT
jgi:hypothetical protein